MTCKVGLNKINYYHWGKKLVTHITLITINDSTSVVLSLILAFQFLSDDIKGAIAISFTYINRDP